MLKVADFRGSSEPSTHAKQAGWNTSSSMRSPSGRTLSVQSSGSALANTTQHV